MIRNIVFDLGNVLLNWKPEDYLLQNGYSDTSRRIIMDKVLRSPEWLMLDNGDITLSEAAERIATKSPLEIPEILSVFDLRISILSPISQNAKLLPELKNMGFRLYYLSNFPGDIFEEVRNKYDMFGHFDGGIISAKVRLSKPDPEIFLLLMKMYSLNPEECIFIDDIAVNSAAAESVGMTGIHLPDPVLLERILEERLGIALAP